MMEPIWEPLAASLSAIPSQLPETPKAVLMVTAHWEKRMFTVQHAQQPPMIYDYGGFPPETYEVQYSAPGQVEVANEVLKLLAEAGIESQGDPERGFDHGTFVPAAVMYPDADMPIVQLSILRTFDPEAHIAAGRALAPLRDQGVLIVGSGLPSFHDLSNLGPGSAEPSRAFDAWLTEVMTTEVGERRSDLLKNWDKAPLGRQAHPREDHFMPLLVAVGAAEGEAASIHYHEEEFAGFTASTGYCVG